MFVRVLLLFGSMVYEYSRQTVFYLILLSFTLWVRQIEDSPNVSWNVYLHLVSHRFKSLGTSFTHELQKCYLLANVDISPGDGAKIDSFFSFVVYLPVACPNFPPIYLSWMPHHKTLHGTSHSFHNEVLIETVYHQTVILAPLQLSPSEPPCFMAFQRGLWNQ